MPKRNNKNDDSDYIKKKIRKLEKKLEKRLRRKINSGSSTESIMPVASDYEDVIEVLPDPDLLLNMADENQPGPSAAVPTLLSDAPEAEIPSETAPIQPELDKEILDLLGETPLKDNKYGPNIQNELAVRWEHIATAGLTKETRKDLVDKHLVPKNCMKIDAPKLNPETKAALSEVLIKKDKALESKQKQLAAGISCIGEALTHIFSLENKDQTVIKLLIDAGRLLCDAQHNESMTRRSFICSSIKKDIKDQLYNTDIDNYLFGQNLADTLRAAKAISKSGAEIKLNTTAKKSNAMQRPKQNSTLNQKPPLPTNRQVGAVRRYQQPVTKPIIRQQQPPRQQPRSQHQPAPRR